MLHGHQPFGGDRQLAIGSQGEGGQDALEIQPAVGSAGAVAIADQVIEPVAVQLAAHKSLDRRAGVAAVLQQVGDDAGRAGGVGFEVVAQGRMLPDQSPRPRLVA